MMINQIFVNLPVKDLDRAIAFWSGLGFTFEPKFTDKNAACLKIGDTIFAMLLTQPFFESFTNKPTADAHVAVEVINSLQLDSRVAVDAIVAKAQATGVPIEKGAGDPDWMYRWTFNDPDGHFWELFFMDERAIPEA